MTDPKFPVFRKAKGARFRGLLASEDFLVGGPLEEAYLCSTVVGAGVPFGRLREPGVPPRRLV